MPGEPIDWNVVVAGAWNVAILSPDGISRRLFGLTPETPIEVQVALDRHAAFRVVHNGILVSPTAAALMVAPIEPTRGALVRAAEVASRAVVGLPETPLSGAGVNLRYVFDPMPRSSSIGDRIASMSSSG